MVSSADFHVISAGSSAALPDTLTPEGDQADCGAARQVIISRGDQGINETPVETGAVETTIREELTERS